jgi:hypothetical protein
LIEVWHEGHDLRMPVHEFLGWTFAEYARYKESGRVPPA